MIDTAETAPQEVELEILRRAQAGDQEAFGTIMQSHYDRVFRTIAGIVRNEHDARDVAQEVWLTVWKNLATFRGEARFSTWVHPIAVRRSIDHLRKRQKWLHRFLPFLNPGDDATNGVPEPAADTDPRRESDRAESAERFEQALQSLPEKHRSVIVLRELEGLSYEEIAKTINCRSGTVMSRLFHARRLLARKLGELP